jgi:outer membrane protein assembly factor BamD (BamD/ComL family)
MRLIRNIIKNTILLSLSILIVSPMSVLAQDMSSAQSEADRAREERSKRDGQRTKKSQAVSKSVYEKITRAQEIMEAGDNEGALKILTALRASSKLSEYEQQNVLNYLGFVYYNMEDFPRAMRAYEDMLRIPSIEEQMAI